VDHLTHLLTRAAVGDRRALEQFIAETQGDVWQLCRYLGDRGVADDLAQETYERAIGSLHRYRAEGAARGWLLSIARRVCADHVRRAMRRRRLDVALSKAAVTDHAAGGVELGAGGRVELDRLLGALDHDRRSAFVLTQVIGLHYDEAADVLGCPVGTIRSRVARARRDLVAMMPNDTTEPATGAGPEEPFDVRQRHAH
jgi:RNA polymerase sigma-70 factor (ECF subfamily)